MDLIERYIHAVGERLPERSRRDIEDELRSLLMDALDAKTEPGKPYAEEDVIFVLKEFGPPQEVARRYAPSPQFLIGPKFFDTYLLVVKIVLGAVALGVTISLAIDFAFSTPSLGDVIGRLLSTLISGALSAIGSVTIVFAILERVLSEKEQNELAQAEDKWDPRQLPTVPHRHSRVKISESVVNICFIALALAVLNLFADKVGGFFHDGTWRFVSFVNQQAVAIYRPYLNFLWIVSLFHHIVLLVKGKWTTGSQVLAIALSLGGIGVLALMISGPSLIDSLAIRSLEGVASGEELKKLAELLTMIFRFGLIGALVAVTADLVRKIVGLVKVVR